MLRPMVRARRTLLLGMATRWPALARVEASEDDMVTELLCVVTRLSLNREVGPLGASGVKSAAPIAAMPIRRVLPPVIESESAAGAGLFPFSPVSHDAAS